jgi:hypothetical protein
MVVMLLLWLCIGQHIDGGALFVNIAPATELFTEFLATNVTIALRDSNFTNCSTRTKFDYSTGGAVYVNVGDDYYGGNFHNVSMTTHSSDVAVTFDGCDFLNNSVPNGGTGGGVHVVIGFGVVEDCTVSFVNCVAIGNSAGAHFACQCRALASTCERGALCGRA